MLLTVVWPRLSRVQPAQWQAVGCIVLANAGAAYTLRASQANAVLEPIV